MTLEQKLNQYLANQQIAYIKLHNLHWYVTGKSFFILHEKFEEYYDTTATILDEVAERILALGHKPVANTSSILKAATLQELPNEDISSKAAIEGLIADYEFWVKETKEVIDLAEANDDPATADQFTAYLADYQKTLWMLNAYLK